MNKAIEPYLMKASTVAAHLGTSPKWVRRKARDGQLPYYKINDRYYFAPADVMQFIERNRVKVAG